MHIFQNLQDSSGWSIILLMTMKRARFKKGRDCYRCGMSRPFVRRERIDCEGYGKFYKQHLWKTSRTK